jgi:metal transporter CNNM
MTPLIWIGIAICISQSAIFSGLNLAVFSVSRLRLEVEATGGNQDARRVLALRRRSNLLLTTILWGNVGVNVLLAQLANSVLAGVLAFLFSTVLITFAGEILPQAYFSRNALRVGAMLSPVLRAYQVILYPVARPTAYVLDRLLGAEKTDYLTEHSLRELITIHARAPDVDVDHVEGAGALNFLAIDDLPVVQEGESIDPESILALDFRRGRAVFPAIEPSCDDPFLRKLDRSGKKWVVITDRSGAPRLALNVDGFLRAALFGEEPVDPHRYCHRPIVVTEDRARLGKAIPRLRVHPRHSEDDVVDEDIILFWGSDRRIITGSDILGRLLRGIVENESVPFEKHARGQ